MINLSDMRFHRSRSTLHDKDYCMITTKTDIIKLRKHLECIDHPNKYFWLCRLNQCYLGFVPVKVKSRIITMLTKRLFNN